MLHHESWRKASSGIPAHVAISSLACRASMSQNAAGKTDKQGAGGDNRVTSMQQALRKDCLDYLGGHLCICNNPARRCNNNLTLRLFVVAVVENILIKYLVLTSIPFLPAWPQILLEISNQRLLLFSTAFGLGCFTHRKDLLHSRAVTRRPARKKAAGELMERFAVWGL